LCQILPRKARGYIDGTTDAALTQGRPMNTKANGVSLNYELTGPAGAPVVMLSHSLAASQDMWWPQIEPLSTNYRVLRYDMRGHGESEAPSAPYSFDDLAKDVVALKTDVVGDESVHFESWPEGLGYRDESLEEDMAFVRRLVSLGRTARTAARIRVRQPLARVMVASRRDLGPELEAEGLARDAVRIVQMARREAGLQVSDRVTLALEASEEVARALETHRAYLLEQTLADALRLGSPEEGDHVHRGRVGAVELVVGLRRA